MINYMEYELEMDFYRDWISHLRNILKQSGNTPTTEEKNVKAKGRVTSFLRSLNEGSCSFVPTNLSLINPGP